MSITTNLLKLVNKTPCYLKTNSCSINLVLRCSTSSIFRYEQDPGPIFINPEVQRLLKSVTRMRIEKVFRKRSVADNTVKYQFMTTQALEKKFNEIANKAEEYMQMPPVVMIKEDVPKIIANDPELKDFSDTKFVFADITFGLKQSKRKVVIRQTDGTLEYAPMDIKKRVNQIFAPLPGRKILTPNMFQVDNLKQCLDEQKYEFILDRLCIQYEPYEKDFHDLCSQVYVHINENKAFELLRSTRHFGPMVFFLAWHNMIDDLLYDMIKLEYLRNSVEVISVLYELKNIEYNKSIHDQLKEIPQSENIYGDLKKGISTTQDDIHEDIKNAIGKSRNDFDADDICLPFIEEFVKNKSMKKVPLELAIQTFKETNDEKKKLYEGLRKAHGIN